MPTQPLVESKRKNLAADFLGQPRNGVAAHCLYESSPFSCVAVKLMKAVWGKPRTKEEVMVVFTRGNRGGSAQHATRATPTRSSHGPMRA